MHGAPEPLTLEVDATLITAHSEKEKAAGNDKGGYGFHPLQVYLDETREALRGLLRPGDAGSNTADDHKAVIDRALGCDAPTGRSGLVGGPFGGWAEHGGADRGVNYALWIRGMVLASRLAAGCSGG